MSQHSKPKKGKIPKNLRRARWSVLGPILGQTRNNLGREREETALEALQRHSDPITPHWLRSSRKATVTEDRQGIDIVAMTDIGKLFIQIKGTERAVEQFTAAHPKGNILPFIINKHKDPGTLRQELISCLERERARIIALRSG